MWRAFSGSLKPCFASLKVLLAPASLGVDQRLAANNQLAATARLLLKGLSGSFWSRPHAGWERTFQKGWPCNLSRNVATKTGLSENGSLVLSFGDGTSGALGLQGDEIMEDAYCPTPINGLPLSTVRIAAGHYHSFAITEGGELWAWGRDKEGQLGRGGFPVSVNEAVTVASSDASSLKVSRGFRDSADSVPSSLPHPVSGLESVHVVAAAGSGVASFAVGKDGSLWAWGKSQRGQLGLGSKTVDSPLPQRVKGLENERIVEVACGWGHTLARTSDGAVFAWGYGVDGRLGFDVETPEPQAQASEFAAETPNAETSGSEARSLSLDEEVDAEIMRERHMPIQWEPKRVEALADVTVVQVACGMDHSLLLSDHGCLYSYGDNTNGQLGRDSQSNGRRNALVRGALQPLFVCHVAAGLSHSLAIARPREDNALKGKGPIDSKLYSWGWAASGQLGREDSDDDVSAAAPGAAVMPDDVAPVLAAAGRAHSVAVADGVNGREVFGWGSGRNGRHGLGHTSDVSEPEALDVAPDLAFKQIVCGFDHTLMLVEAPIELEGDSSASSSDTEPPG